MEQELKPGSRRSKWTDHPAKTNGVLLTAVDTILLQKWCGTGTMVADATDQLGAPRLEVKRVS